MNWAPTGGPTVMNTWRAAHIPELVEAYLALQAEPKQTDLRKVHARVLAEFPDCRLWFDDGLDKRGQVVANPNIGYGVLHHEVRQWRVQGGLSGGPERQRRGYLGLRAWSS